MKRKKRAAKNRNVKHATFDDLKKRLMTDEKHRAIEAKLRFLIDCKQYTLRAEPTLFPLGNKIREELARSIVGGNPKSSAMFPVPQNPPQWVVGCFGSVWVDMEIDGTIVRVHNVENEFLAEDIGKDYSPEATLYQ